LQGISGAPGLASGPAFHWQKQALNIPKRDRQDPIVEHVRLEQAVQTACVQIQVLLEQMAAGGLAAEAEVFGAHIQLVRDKGLHRRVESALATGMNAESAWSQTVEAYARQLDGMPDATFSLRAADLRDVGERVLRILLNLPIETAALTQPSVIIARDLTPSETVSLKKEFVLAFCTAEGGPTSHAAILAKALRLPSVVSLGEAVLRIPAGTLLLVDGTGGRITVAPDDASADRTNPKVAYLSDHCHPAVLRLIAQTTRAAHDAGIRVGVCGEMAGDPEAIPLLAGIGVDELSMSPGLIPHAKCLLRRLTLAQAEILLHSALLQDSAAEVRQLVRCCQWVGEQASGR